MIDIGMIIGIATIIIAIILIIQKTRTPTPETSTPETPAQSTETKKFPVGAVIAIALLIIGGLAIWFIAIPFLSTLGDSSSKNSQKTANAEKIVTVIVPANGISCAVSPFFEKGQTIVITAEGEIAGPTNNPTYEYVGPGGWRQNPNLEYKKFLPAEPYMGLIGKTGKPELSGEWFYVGREKSITTERAGTEEVCFDYNRMNKKNNYENNKGYCTVTIRIAE